MKKVRDSLIDLLYDFASNEVCCACQRNRDLAAEQNSLLDQVPKNALHVFAHDFAYIWVDWVD